MRAHQIMTRPVITVTPETTIVEAANTMLYRHISGLPVVDAAGKLVGIVSEGDFIRRSEIGTQRKRGKFLKFILGAGKEASDFVHEHGGKVGEIMTPEPLTISEGAELEEIVELMEKHHVKRMPVMRGDSSSASYRAPTCCRRSQVWPARFPIRPPTTTISATASSTPWRSRTGVRSASASSCVTASFI